MAEISNTRAGRAGLPCRLALAAACAAAACSDGDDCERVTAYICHIEAPSSAAAGAPIPVTVTFLRDGCVEHRGVRHRLEGSQVIVTGDAEYCCKDCACDQGTTVLAYQLPGLAAGSWRIKAEHSGAGRKVCDGLPSHVTEVDVVVK